MTRQYFNFLLISAAIILTLIWLTEKWLDPDPKGIGHALIYYGAAFLFGATGTVFIVISFFKKANWLTFLKILFGLINSLFLIVFFWSLTADISILFLVGYTTLTGLILIALTIKQIYADTKTKT